MNQTELDVFLAAIPLAALAVGPDDRVVAINGPCSVIFGSGIAGQTLALRVRNPAILEAVGEVQRGGEARQVRMALTRGTLAETYLVAVSPILNGRVLCVFQDISGEETAGRLRRDFVANVSHELRTPLTALMGFIETLSHAARDDPVARERFLGIMEHEAGRMNRLVQDLLHLSRVEAEERVRPRTLVNLADLLQGTVAGLRPLAEAAGARISIGAADGSWVVPGDQDQLTQVFTNLIENAVKYGRPGQSITIQTSQVDTIRGPAVRVDVRDQGEGIDQVHIPRLTERFYRVDTHRSREKGGTGLGLAIVKHIVNRHRGWLKVESLLGQGSVFSVILPTD